ncbi:MAG: ParA family protein [Paracoccaceae bacterium]
MKIIACYSNKGGVGKTALAVNVAHGLAAAGQRVLLCDLDPQGASGFYFRVKASRKLKDEKFFRDVEKFTSAIRESDFQNLDILPANMTFRDFDVFLSRMKNSRSRLKKALVAVDGDYDVIVLDCPPNISTLSESVFAASDLVMVPVIPTTLAERTFEQLAEFFRDHKIRRNKMRAVFSMVQSNKTLHKETMARMRDQYGKRILETTIPFSTDVEKMGVQRLPVACYAGTRPAGKAYADLVDEIRTRLA